ncbi:putative endonuclease lcl3 [Taxawa tesnikishii (nom. ined.)]|nr:putative endonuclease lcl3 [Dothideales sp. JES 119]
MPWPQWLSSDSTKNTDKDDNAAARESLQRPRPPPPPPPPKPATSWDSSLNATDWSHYTSPQTIITSTIFSLATLTLYRLYRLHLRRIPSAAHITPSAYRSRSLFGYVTSVGDGDGFRLFHTPGGRLAGWGWFPGRRIQTWKGKEVKDATISVRIAGVDAPETAHFGKPAQPYSAEALAGLRELVLRKYVWAKVWRPDQYGRVVASVKGLATVYEAKFGSEFGDMEEVYRRAEETAKRKGVGLWGGEKELSWWDRLMGRKNEVVETPRQFKRRMNAAEKGQAELRKGAETLQRAQVGSKR